MTAGPRTSCTARCSASIEDGGRMLSIAGTGERLSDVLMFRVTDLEEKELLLASGGVYFTTPHFKGYPAVLVRIPDLDKLSRDELRDLVVDAWLSRAQKRVAKAWLAANEPGD